LLRFAEDFVMASGWWDQQVQVMIGSSTTYTVARPRHAADLLLNDWPDVRGPAYERAAKAIMAAINDPASDSLNVASRLAFEEAARDADILVPLPNDENYTRR